MTKKKKKVSINLPKLRSLLSEFCSEVDLRVICFDLDVDYDSVVPSSVLKVIAVMAIITYFNNRGRLGELITRSKKEFPNAPWGRISGEIAIAELSEQASQIFERVDAAKSGRDRESIAREQRNTSTEFVPDEISPNPKGIWISPDAAVWRDGNSLGIHLAQIEHRLLKYLMQHTGEINAYNDVILAVWGTLRDKHRLHRLIYRVRHKIEPDPTHPKFLIICSGIGVTFYPEGEPVQQEKAAPENTL